MATDLKKWGRFPVILEDPRVRSSRKVVIGDGIDRQDNDSDRSRIVIRSQKQRQSRKKKPKIGGSWNLALFFSHCAVHRVYIYIVAAHGQKHK